MRGAEGGGGRGAWLLPWLGQPCGSWLLNPLWTWINACCNWQLLAGSSAYMPEVAPIRCALS